MEKQNMVLELQDALNLQEANLSAVNTNLAAAQVACLCFAAVVHRRLSSAYQSGKATQASGTGSQTCLVSCNQHVGPQEVDGSLNEWLQVFIAQVIIEGDKHQQLMFGCHSHAGLMGSRFNFWHATICSPLLSCCIVRCKQL